MGSGSSNPINQVTDFVDDYTHKVTDGVKWLGEKADDAQSFVDKNIYDPVFSSIRPVTEVGGKIFDMKNDFINSNIPWAVPLIDGLQYMPYVGESIKTINDIEKVLKLINSGKYKEAQNMAIKKGVLMYIQSQLPVPVSEKMMETALDTIELS